MINEFNIPLGIVNRLVSFHAFVKLSIKLAPGIIENAPCSCACDRVELMIIKTIGAKDKKVTKAKNAYATTLETIVCAL